MNKKKHYYITCMGEVWRLSPRSYKKLLTLIAEEKDYNLWALGKSICIIDENVTDMEAQTAADLLEDLTSER